MENESIRVIRLEADNIKRLRAVAIQTDSNFVEIAGNNAQGKTSVMDALWWCLAGNKPVQGEPIRRGANTARIEVTLGNGGKAAYIVTRKFTKKTKTLKVTTADGTAVGSPQELLDGLFSAITFDPLEYTRMKPADQAAALADLVGVNFAAKDAEIKTLYDQRTEVNREARGLHSQADAITYDCLPGAVAENETALLTALTNAAQTNSEINAELARRKKETEAIAVARAVVKGKRKEAEDLLDYANQIESTMNDKEAKLAALPPVADPVDAMELRAKLDAARAGNAEIAKRDRREALARQAMAKDAESAVLSSKMKKLEQDKLDAIEQADMPIKGLSFGDNCVTFNGIPLEQASDAEQLKISTSIAAAMNPKLKLIRIRDGSLLDLDSMAWLKGFAEEKDCQVFIETVGAGSGPAAIVMRDGEVQK